jgi:hypothetical protein
MPALPGHTLILAGWCWPRGRRLPPRVWLDARLHRHRAAASYGIEFASAAMTTKTLGAAARWWRGARHARRLLLRTARPDRRAFVGAVIGELTATEDLRRQGAPASRRLSAWRSPPLSGRLRVRDDRVFAAAFLSSDLRLPGRREVALDDRQDHLRRRALPSGTKRTCPPSP